MILNKIERLENLVTARTRNLLLILILLIATLFAIKNSFIQDDAFISFRYAYNLIHYDNFSWNENDVVKLEGYTNFSWTVLMAACIKMGLDPVVCSMVIGIILGIGTLITTYKIADLVLRDFRYSLLTVFLLGVNYSFSAYMTGGLETQLQTFLIALISFFSFKAILRNDSAFLELTLISFFSGLAILTRLDSPLLIGILVLAVLFFRYRAAPEKKVMKTVSAVFLLAVPVLIIVLPWLFWKYNYYGDILPNSFYLKGKVFSSEVIKNGIVYLFTFFASYYLLVFCLILVFHFNKIINNKFLLTIVVILLAWSAYIVKVGGDFMEFRFMVPVLPLLFTAVVWSIQQLEGKVVKYVCVLVVLCGSVSHQVLFFDFHGTDSIKKLHGIIYEKETNWEGIGVTFNELFFDARDSIVIATTAAGAIPYYSKLTTIDMFGVNDKWIALNGDGTRHFKPGHHRWAKIDYYLKTNVNLVIGHPEVRTKAWSEGRDKLSLIDFDNFRISSLERESLPAEAKIVEIPIDKEYNVFALYLKPTQAIDSILNNNNIKSFEID
jgi:hypothetical protein